MKAIFLYLTIILLFLLACNKEEDEPRTPVLAGVFNSSMNYKEWNPAFQVTLQHDGMRNMDYGKDSLDINQDGSYDVIISQNNLRFNSSANNNSIDIFPFYYLSLKNGLSIAVIKEPNFTVINQLSNAYWVDTIAYKTNLENITNWSDSYSNNLSYATPPTVFFGYDGPWYGLSNKEAYIAMRIHTSSRYRYGWIKVNVTSPEKVSIISYALEK
ncbi:MAG: hypothetical protein ACM3P1_12290 [Candidatus Saccharibacteria bacterium]